MYETLTRMLIEDLQQDPAKIHPDTTFRELDMDSLSLAELAVMIENATGRIITLTDQDTTLAQAAELYASAGTPAS
ncbi:acyl carrier protein [Streptomyces sp. NPDC016459]|uniref:acyl carrier protein n=1 Tax=Streptomyces sp. NPDC016459 TaxID=3157190 RepID=UPI0033C0FFF3